MTEWWERVVAHIQRHDVTFFLLMLAAVAILPMCGL